MSQRIDGLNSDPLKPLNNLSFQITTGEIQLETPNEEKVEIKVEPISPKEHRNLLVGFRNATLVEHLLQKYFK